MVVPYVRSPAQRAWPTSVRSVTCPASSAALSRPPGVGMWRNDHRPTCRVGVNNLQFQVLTEAQPHIHQGAGRIAVDLGLVVRGLPVRRCGGEPPWIAGARRTHDGVMGRAGIVVHLQRDVLAVLDPQLHERCARVRQQPRFVRGIGPGFDYDLRCRVGGRLLHHPVPPLGVPLWLKTLPERAARWPPHSEVDTSERLGDHTGALLACYFHCLLVRKLQGLRLPIRPFAGIDGLHVE